MLDDRDYYRTKTNSDLLLAAREQGVTTEMGVVLAERLHSRTSDGYGLYQPRSK
jgi:hypothetical protein